MNKFQVDEFNVHMVQNAARGIDYIVNHGDVLVGAIASDLIEGAYTSVVKLSDRVINFYSIRMTNRDFFKEHVDFTYHDLMELTIALINKESEDTLTILPQTSGVYQFYPDIYGEPNTIDMTLNGEVVLKATSTLALTPSKEINDGYLYVSKQASVMTPEELARFEERIKMGYDPFDLIDSNDETSFIQGTFDPMFEINSTLSYITTNDLVLAFKKRIYRLMSIALLKAAN